MSKVMTLGLYRVGDDFVVVPVLEGEERRLEFVFPSDDLVADYMRIAGASQRSRTLEIVSGYKEARALAGARLDDSRDAVIFEIADDIWAVATILGDGEYSGHQIPVITDLREGAEMTAFSNAGKAEPANFHHIVMARRAAA